MIQWMVKDIYFYYLNNKNLAEQTTKQINASGATGGGKAPGGKAATGGFTVKALYDYTAADKDEVCGTQNKIKKL